MKKFSIVFHFELMSYLKSKSFRITTAIMIIVTLLLGFIPVVISQVAKLSGDGQVKEQEEIASPVGIYDPQGILADEVLDAYFTPAGWVGLDSGDTGIIEEAVLSGINSLVLSVDGLNFTVTLPGSKAMQVSVNQYSELIKQGYQSLMLRNSGFSKEEADALVSAVPEASVVTVGKDTSQSFWIGYVLLILLYMSIIMYSSYVMTSVASEKSSKTVELLITTIKPVYLIFGKVMGAGIAGLIQLSAVLLVGIASLNFSGSMTDYPLFEGILQAVSGLTIVYALVFFVLGFFSFAFLFAAFASTVNRLEEVQTVSMVPMMIFIAVFLVAIFSMSNPTAGYVVFVSFVPFLSPLVMFMRVCMTDVTAWQITAGIAVNLLTIVGAGIFGAKLYRAGVLMYGTKPTFKKILRSFLRS